MQRRGRQNQRQRPCRFCNINEDEDNNQDEKGQHTESKHFKSQMPRAHREQHFKYQKQIISPSINRLFCNRCVFSYFIQNFWIRSLKLI